MLSWNERQKKRNKNQRFTMNVIASALRRYAEPTKFLNITALPAWASPAVRLHKPSPAHELNQSLSNTGFPTLLKHAGIIEHIRNRNPSSS